MNLPDPFTLNRAIARRISPLLARTGITPNQITALALLSGVCGALAIAKGTRWGLVQGAFFLHLSYILDDCDGAVARLRKLSTRLGMWWDYAADLIVDMALWAGLAFATARQGFAGPALVAAVAAAFGSVLHFVSVISARLRDETPHYEGKRPWIESLSGDGDPSLLIWVLAWIGYPGYFLLFGSIYVNALWIIPLVRARITFQKKGVSR